VKTNEEEAEMKFYGGLDLHSTNVVIQLINEKRKGMAGKLFCEFTQEKH